MSDPYLPETPSQTAGPYVHIGLIPNQAGFDIFANNFSGDIAGPDVAGERIVIEGRIFDASGHIAKDVLVETWQANAAGRYNHPADRSTGEFDESFRGWGRALRRAIGNWYLGQEPRELAYQLCKYQHRNGWCHRDLLRLTHPKPVDGSPTALALAWEAGKSLGWDDMDEYDDVAGNS